MRMLLKVSFPVESGNRAARDGTLAKTIQAFAEAASPESMVFAVDGGERSMFAVFDMASTSQLPPLCEPMFMNLNASVSIQPCMTAQELAAGFAAAGLG